MLVPVASKCVFESIRIIEKNEVISCFYRHVHEPWRFNNDLYCLHCTVRRVDTIRILKTDLSSK